MSQTFVPPKSLVDLDTVNSAFSRLYLPERWPTDGLLGIEAPPQCPSDAFLGEKADEMTHEEQVALLLLLKRAKTNQPVMNYASTDDQLAEFVETLRSVASRLPTDENQDDLLAVLLEFQTAYHREGEKIDLSKLPLNGDGSLTDVANTIRNVLGDDELMKKSRTTIVTRLDELHFKLIEIPRRRLFPKTHLIRYAESIRFKKFKRERENSNSDTSE